MSRVPTFTLATESLPLLALARPSHTTTLKLGCLAAERGGADFGKKKYGTLKPGWGLTSRVPLSVRGRHSLHDHGLLQGVIAK